MGNDGKVVEREHDIQRSKTGMSGDTNCDIWLSNVVISKIKIFEMMCLKICSIRRVDRVRKSLREL